MLNTKDITVLHISPSYKPAYCYGGPTLSVAKLCEALNISDNGMNVRVFTTTANGATELEYSSGSVRNIEGVEVFFYSRLTKDHTHFSPALLFNLYRYVKRARADACPLILHIHSWWNMVAILAAGLAKLLGVPTIISPRGMITDYTLSFRNTVVKFLIHNLLGKRLLKNAHLHATTAMEANHIMRFIANTNISVIPNLLTLHAEDICSKTAYGLNRVDPSWNTMELPALNRHLNILFLSRIDRKKGLETLLRALASLKFSWSLTVAGSGAASYVRYLKQMSGMLKISRNVNWIGQVGNEAKSQLMFNHDLLVLPSSNENFGNVVLESLLVGTPVLISDHVGLASYVKTADLGWICPAESAVIAQTLSEISLDISKRMKIRNSAPNRIRRDFNTETIINQYVKMYKKALLN